MEKLTHHSEQEGPHFEVGQTVRAPLEIKALVEENSEQEFNNKAEKVKASEEPEVLADWYISAIGKDGLVNLTRGMTNEEKGLMGIERKNITFVKSISKEELKKYN